MDRSRIQHLTFTGHALRQMFARGIMAEEVRAAITSGETIADYPDDQPWPVAGSVAGSVLQTCKSIVRLGNRPTDRARQLR
jgi:hypothetical protein